MMRFPRSLLPLAAAMMITPVHADDTGLDGLRAELARQKSLIAAQQQQLDALAGSLEKQQAPSASATHVGFYGEVHYNAFREEDPVIGKSNFHAHRAVILLSHEFADNLHFYSEVEFEGAPDSSDIETELEQLFIDWKINPALSLNIGQFLLPVGLMNESHEPNVFYGVERNPVEEKIIPATWWEKGVMARFLPADGVAVDLAVHNGLRGDVAGLGGADGLREFRQEFGGSRAQDMGYTLRVKYQRIQGLELGATIQRQDNINDRATATDHAPATLLEAHADWQVSDFRLRALLARWAIDGNMAKALGADRMEGGYLEPSWKVTAQTGVFARYNRWNTAANAIGQKDEAQVNVGLNYWVHPQVVLKADIQSTNRPGGQGDGFNLGAGLSF
ncbi:phosphate-selective porin O/P [Fluviicoccus keumensis]|uniref:Phosphate-selective porin O/P n=1 Tax=Fluviicoccus keumensis TaxID=1435465 RepID=A0A4Q7YL36_9GAMM|nr:porin [Fluviicoccus keumensis]RZU38267.1 phosphate-selective porin O/P [Fluviicoccus keumensis]